MNTTNPESLSDGVRVVMSIAAVAFLLAGGLLAYVVVRLLFMTPAGFDFSVHDQLFWALCGVVAFCLLLLAINFTQAVVHRRARNVVPGPTLYLLGVTLAIIGMFVGTSGSWITAIILMTSGFACMSLEYRSEFI